MRQEVASGGDTRVSGSVFARIGVVPDPARKADPFRDTDVIDARAVRFNQATTGTVALLGALFGWPLAWALMAGQLVIGLTLGRRWCLPCLAFFALIQPRVGEGRLEDSRPPRFANMVGVAFLGGAAASWWLGVETLGVVLGAIVASLAVLSASTGFCAGCFAYRLGARLRGVSPRHQGHLDPADLAGLDGHPRAYVEFTHPLCSDCLEWERRLRAAEEPLLTIDVSARPELARKYGIAVVPTVLAVASDGEVLERLAP
jgi:hypothetical protein